MARMKIVFFCLAVSPRDNGLTRKYLRFKGSSTPIRRLLLEDIGLSLASY
jgi:hypothetical protein